MLPWTEILLRLALAALFGGLIGIERERRNWTAGLRTHMMVCVGATLTMMVSSFGFADILGTPNVGLDPSRIAAQVVSGIGFIGAGTIMFLRQEVIRGLTTASGLWTVAAIGLATGGGMYFAATATTIIAIIILSLLKPVQKKFFKRYKYQQLKIIADNVPDVVQTIQAIIEKQKISVANVAVEKSGGKLSVQVRFLSAGSEKDIAALLDMLQQLPFTQQAVWNNN